MPFFYLQTIDELIETGNSEQIFQKAIQEQGRGQVWYMFSNVYKQSKIWLNMQRSLFICSLPGNGHIGGNSRTSWCCQRLGKETSWLTTSMVGFFIFSYTMKTAFNWVFDAIYYSLYGVIMVKADSSGSLLFCRFSWIWQFWLMHKERCLTTLNLR